MDEREKLLGRNVAQLRGGRSQQAVADAMRERGWKWSQSTMWSLEGGGRSLRLLEAQDLADVLGVSLTQLTLPAVEVRATMSLRRSLHLLLSARDYVGELVDKVGPELRSISVRAAELTEDTAADVAAHLTSIENLSCQQELREAFSVAYSPYLARVRSAAEGD